jgi:hypothetical protein
MTIFTSQYADVPSITGLRSTVKYILQAQLPNGCIPWFVGGKADPWDHIEAAMGLTIGGEYAAARAAYRWLAQEQLPDGSWWANYADYSPVDRDHRETNFIAYIATGIWHYFLITGDRTFLLENFSYVTRAINFVLRYQASSGAIYWAVHEDGRAKEDSLITANASIYKSLECAILCAKELAVASDEWRRARQRLGAALRYHPEVFDRTWESKERFSMDWFYPILTGVLQGEAGHIRIAKRWVEFVKPQVGCRCVSDEPWVTVAESCELTLALLAIGDRTQALAIFNDLQQFLTADGGYWTGYNFRDDAIWPKEKTTWTAGAILLAADALAEHTAAARLFVDAHSEDFGMQLMVSQVAEKIV